MLPDYDYIDDEDNPKSSTITNESTPRVDIYNIPVGDTMKFINQSGGKVVLLSEEGGQVPGPYLIPNESIYEDPGVQKEKIYEWIDKKKFRKLERAEIK